MVPATPVMKIPPWRVLFCLLIIAVAFVVSWNILLPQLRVASQSFLPLPEVLTKAKYVTIRRTGDNTPKPIRLSAVSHPRVLDWFKASSANRSSPPDVEPDFTIGVNITTSTVATYRYGYVSATGQIGQGKEWCQTPPAFQSWMLALKAKSPGRAVPPPPEPGDPSPIVVSPRP